MPPPKPAPVPQGRLARLVRIGGMAGGVAGGMLAGGVRAAAQGQRPDLAGLLLTPGNALRVTQGLSQMRGAAMKLGQLLSMDAGTLLPPDLAAPLAALRADAAPMPQAQLLATLTQRWGKGWQARFARFDMAPLAAASIGQVHRALTTDGRDLAIKVQYPGVAASIDSDLRNMAALLRLPGLLPQGFDPGPFLDTARAQLRAEADYTREAAQTARFGALLADAAGFVLPEVQPDFCVPGILAMTHLDSQPIDSLTSAPQALRDDVATRLLALTLRELFELGLMQTDPNFANYRWQPASGRIVLLDFGAVQEVTAEMAARHRAVLRAGLAGDAPGLQAAMAALGLLPPDLPAAMQTAALQIADMAFAPLRAGGIFDFGTTDILHRLRDAGFALATDRRAVQAPATDTLFLHRRIAGMVLLATQLRARVDTAALLAPYA